MRVYCCQFDIAWENKSANFARILSLLKANPPEPGSMLLLPEMFATGFTTGIANLAEEPGGPTAQFLSQIARQFKIHVVAGIVEKDSAAQVYNRAAIVDPQGRAGAQYTKLHPFHPGGETSQPGGEVIRFAWGPFTVSPFICYDLRFPEIFRHAVMAGANLLVVVACWPTARQAHWSALLRARAIENQCFVAAVNRCGSDPHFSYCGASLILDPRGQVLVEAGDSEGLFSVELDLDSLLAYRRDFPVLQDMRKDFLSPFRID